LSLSHTKRVEMLIMNESVWLEGFLDDELREIDEWFAGAVAPGRAEAPSLTIQLVRSQVVPPPGSRTVVRHRASLRPKTCFLDGSEFDQQSQLRDISIVFEAPTLACLAVPGAVLVTTIDRAVVFAPAAPPLLLSDLLENWLLWRAREAGQVMVHASGWIRGNAVEMFVGSSGDGKTTELLRQVELGARYFANDRIALRTERGQLLGRTFPEPVNVGAGTIRSLGLDLPTHGLDDRCAVRLLAADVAARWAPDCYGWYPIERIVSRNRQSYEQNVYWSGDPDHPFWNRALRPRDLVERPELERAMEERLSFVS
jgi:hypothetical protein